MPKNGTTKTKVASKKRVHNPESKPKNAKRGSKMKSDATSDADNVPSDKEQSQSEADPKELAKLEKANRDKRTKLEKLIDTAWNTAVKADKAGIKAGKGILELRQKELFKPDYPSFKDYANSSRWSRQYLYFLQDAAQVAVDVYGDADVPDKLSMTALGQVARIKDNDPIIQAKERKAFLNGFLSGQNDKVITVSQIKDAVNAHLGKGETAKSVSSKAQLAQLKEQADILVPILQEIEEVLPGKLKKKCSSLFDLLRSLTDGTGTGANAGSETNDEDQG